MSMENDGPAQLLNASGCAIEAENKRCLDAAIELTRIQQSDTHSGPDGLRIAIGVIGERFAANKIGIREWPSNRNQQGWDFIDLDGSRVQVKSSSQDGWIQLVTRKQVEQATGKTPGRGTKFSPDELRKVLESKWDRLAVVVINDDVEPTLVGDHDIETLIAGHHLNGDNGGLYVKVLPALSGLLVCSEELRATEVEV